MTNQTSSTIVAALATMLLAGPIARAEGAFGPGWTPLFNGTNLDGWTIHLQGQAKNADPTHLVRIEDGVLHFYKDAEAGSAQPLGYIATQMEYSHYRLRLEFKWGEKKFAPRTQSRRNSGLLYHVTVVDKVWPDSVEYQIQEQDVGDIYAISTRVTSPVDPQTTNITLSTNRTTGAVRTNASAQPRFLERERGGVLFQQGRYNTTQRVIRNPLNERDGWNLVEIIVQSDRATHLLNGQVINRCSNILQFADGKWSSLARGRIGLQLEGAEILYRNVEIQVLEE